MLGKGLGGNISPNTKVTRLMSQLCRNFTGNSPCSLSDAPPRQPGIYSKLCEICGDALNLHKTAVNSGYKQHQIKTGNYKVDVVLRDPICVQE